jgi:hypothetical protein
LKPVAKKKKCFKTDKEKKREPGEDFIVEGLDLG